MSLNGQDRLAGNGVESTAHFRSARNRDVIHRSHDVASFETCLGSCGLGFAVLYQRHFKESDVMVIALGLNVSPSEVGAKMKRSGESRSM